MMKFFKGHKFTVCSLEELYKNGWGQNYRPSSKRYSHKDFPRYVLPPDEIMIKFEGKTLTVDYISTFATNCYWVEAKSVLEKSYIYEWPVSAFEKKKKERMIEPKKKFPFTLHVCTEGMTPLDGWFICKNCGLDLRPI